MREIDGFLLTDAEAKACLTLIKKMRKEEAYKRELKFMNKGRIYCPVNGWDCPYYDANGCCMMYPDTDPINECDDFAMFWEKGDDYVCYDEEEE